MLGWLHQAAAGEKELVAALLGDANDDMALPDPTAETRDDGEARAKEASRDDAGDPGRRDGGSRDGVGSHLRRRVPSVQSSRGTGAHREPGTRWCHTLANLLAFYERTLSDVAGRDAALTATVEELHRVSLAAFDAEMTRRAAALRKMSVVPPTRSPRPSLSPRVRVRLWHFWSLRMV